MDNVIEILKMKDINIPKMLFLNYKVLGINEKELIIIIYLINNNDLFNPKLIANELKWDFKDVLENINELSNKGIVKIEMKTINKIQEEFINIDGLYDKLSYLLIDKKEESTNLFDIFEKEFGRTLSSIEYEIINGWKENNYSEEIIILSLKEAVYNGVFNLRYIDKILFDWNKKGIKTKEDVEKDKESFKNKKIEKKELFDYDWLNENE